jgi:hypothetical protein
MKNPFSFLFTGLFLLTIACNKEAATSARLVVVNGTHSVNALSVNWTNKPVTPAPLSPASYSGTTGNVYTDIEAGTNTLLVQNGAAALLDKNIYAQPGGAYTLLAYDTAKTAGTTRMLYLLDNIQPNTSDTARIRFLYLVPDTAAVDVILLRTIKNDTIFSTARFIGKEADERSIQDFSERKDGAAIGIKINKAGTNVLLLSANGYTFEKKSYYTLIYSGLPGAAGVAAPQLTVIKH